MSTITAPQRPSVAPGSVRNFAVDFRGVLDAGESLTGTPSVIEETTADLLIESERVSVQALTINGRSVPAGRAVQFRASGFLGSRASYAIKIVVDTDASPSQTIIAKVVALVASN